MTECNTDPAKQLDSKARVHGLEPYHQDFSNAEQLDTAPPANCLTEFRDSCLGN